MIFIVSPGQSIQRAVDAASPGDTILVRPGTYNESVSLDADDSRLRIVGAGAGKTIVDGSGLPAGQAAFTLVQATFVTIAGFTISNFVDSPGIDLTNSDDTIIRDNEITRNQENGVTLEMSQRTLIKENRIEENGHSGIRISAGSEQTYVSDNKLNRNGVHGLHVFGGPTLVYQNEANQNGTHGADVGASAVWIIKNEFRKNTASGIFVHVDTEHHFIAGNESVENGGDGLHLSTGSGHIVLENTFSHNGGEPGGDSSVHGIFASSSETLLYANTVEGNTGTNINGSGSFTQSLILANLIKGSGGEGLDTAGSDEDRILSNRVEKNAGAGIFISTGRHLIDDNSVNENRVSGILLTEAASHNVVRFNKLKANKPFDIEAQPPAEEGNSFDLNQCETSSHPSVGG